MYVINVIELILEIFNDKKILYFLKMYEIGIFIFLFPRSGNEGTCGVEFRHSTRNSSIIRQKVGNGIVSMSTGCLLGCLRLAIPF